jgi:peptidoglycan-N-acetylglucosamine deacetylase
VRGMRLGIVAVAAGAVLGVAAYEAPGALAGPAGQPTPAHSAAVGVAPAHHATAAPGGTSAHGGPAVHGGTAAGDVPATVHSGPATTPPTRPVTTATPSRTIPHGQGPAGSLMRTGGRGVALTFDDGPDPVQTPKILDLLAQYHVHATFCLVGTNVRAHPELVRRIVAEGHTVCNHSWNHDEQLGRKSPAAIEADLRRTNEAIHAAAPDARIEYMRAPGGNFTKPFVAVVTKLGMTSLYWSVDPRDWDHSGGESDSAHRARVIAAVTQQCRPGAIILSHDFGQPDTIAAYRQLLPWLTARYQLVPLA